MCGIAGFIDFNRRSDEQSLFDMTDALQHRGPDGRGSEFIEKNWGQIGLGHRRLAVIDLSETGKQPMSFHDIWVTFNGEIYNYKEIKEVLLGLGHSFIGNSDTEVVLHAYSQWGIECIDKFIGMFAFVLVDQKKSKIYCVRDRAGVKPFFYYWNKGLFLFASELKSFYKHKEFAAKLNLEAVASFVQLGNVPAPQCILQDCYKLRPGHLIELNTDSRELKIAEYWSVYNSYNKPKLSITFDEAKKETEKLLISAANYRMISDVPVGVFLSGGYDSAGLTMLLQLNRTEKIKTYTIGVSDMGLNEAPFAKKIAEYIGTDHHEFFCNAAEALDIIEDLPFFYDEPFADSSAIPTILVSKMARKEVTVALSADGGDELFAGYNRYDLLMKELKYLKRTPDFVKRSGAGIMNFLALDSLPLVKDNYKFKNKYKKIKNLLADSSDKNLVENLSKQFESKELKDLFVESPNNMNEDYFKSELNPEFYSPLAYMMAVDYQTYLPDDILQKVDRASMSVSLEAREPYLDHRLIEWAAQLPDEFKYKNGCKKFILKEIVHDRIPKELMHRPKMGFAVPINEWLANDLSEKVNYFLSETRLESHGIFNSKTVSKYVQDFMNGRKELGVKIWYLLMFQMWYERWEKEIIS